MAGVKCGKMCVYKVTLKWFWLFFWVAKRVVLVVETNHKAQLCKTSAGVNSFGTEKKKVLQRYQFQSSEWEVPVRALWPCLRDTNSYAATSLVRWDAEPLQVLWSHLNSLSSCPQVPLPSLLSHYLSGCLLLCLVVWRCNGLMVSVFDPGSSSLGSSLAWGHCVVFLCKTLFAHTASLHTVV